MGLYKYFVFSEIANILPWFGDNSHACVAGTLPKETSPGTFIVSV